MGGPMKRFLLLFFWCGSYLSPLAFSQRNFINQFDGSVAYSVAISAGVTLNYSSALMPRLTASENRDMEASWVGAGWSLEIGAIEADLKGTSNTADDEWFYIHPTGGRSQIVKDNLGVYRLDDNPYWKIEMTKVVEPDYDELVTGITVIRDDGS